MATTTAETTTDLPRTRTPAAPPQVRTGPPEVPRGRVEHAPSTARPPAGQRERDGVRVVGQDDAGVDAQGDRTIDLPSARAAVAALLAALGRDTTSAHLADTPRRVADAFVEMLTPRPFALTTFPNDEGYDELVLVREIPFHSLCEHHLLPFHGVAHIAYMPGERIVGLSKLVRVLEHLSRDLQVQERLTQQVADLLDQRLAPRGVGVVLEAEHMCMALRGVGVTGSRTVTSALRGVLREDGRSRAEFLALVGIGTAVRRPGS